jgi:hypothetical protein
MTGVKLNDSSFPRILARQLAGKEFKLGDDSLVLSAELIEFVITELKLEQYVKTINGVIPSAILPANFSTRYTAASQAEMLALGARIGETCIRTDLKPRQIFTVIDEPSNVLGSWDNITDQIASITINGHSGPAFNLTAADVGAITQEQLTTALVALRNTPDLLLPASEALSHNAQVNIFQDTDGIIKARNADARLGFAGMAHGTTKVAALAGGTAGIFRRGHAITGENLDPAKMYFLSHTEPGKFTPTPVPSGSGYLHQVVGFPNSISELWWVFTVPTLRV